MDSQYAIVELLGHQRFGAKVQETELCGVKLLHCEVLTDPTYVRMVSPAALYAMTPCTEERAKLACKFLASPLVVRSNPPRASLPAPGDPFDDAESDDIPFDVRSPCDDRPEDPEESDETEPILEEFECEQCKSQLTETLSDGMYLPEGWAGVPAGWSLIARGPDDNVYFCGESCVRAFMGKPPSIEEPTGDGPEDAERLRRLFRAVPSSRIEVSGPLSMRYVEVLGDWYCLERDGGLRLTDSAVEGTLSEMLLLARAIQARESYSAMRCAVRVLDDRVYFWSPYGSEQKAVVPLAVADVLASEIRSVATSNATKEEPRE